MDQRKRVGLYCRVSTQNKGQTVENQLLDLRKYAEARGWQIACEFSDFESGTKDERKGLAEILGKARRREIDCLLVWRFDRFSRSLSQLVAGLEELNQIGCEFVSFTESIDTTTPTGKLLFGIVGAIAAFERSILIERIHAGLRRARSQHKKLGRKPAPEFDLQEARRLLSQGLTKTEVGKRFGVSRMTILRRLANEQKG